jgi:dienelactone hydrolase
MKAKALSIFVGIFLLVSMLAVPAPALAWSSTPQKVVFVNDQGIRLKGWLFRPAGTGPFPAVVMMHGCAGVYSDGRPGKGITSLYREWGDRLVKAGYVALLVDSFSPRNAPQNQCNGGRPVVSEVRDRPYDAYAGLKYLTSLPYVSADKIGLLGWSQGGSAVMASMHITKYSEAANFKAAVAFYAGCGLYNAFGGVENSKWKPYAPMVFLHGSADTVVRVNLCRIRIRAARALGATQVGITVFANAHHKFDQATRAGNGFTQADVRAKKAADPQAMQFFATYLR